MANEKKRRNHMIRGNRKKLSANDIIQENIVDDTPAEAINNDGERVFVPKTPKSGKSKLDEFMESMHHQSEYNPLSDIKIELETIPSRKHDDWVVPLDNPYYNDALDMDQQSPDFWDSI